MQGVDNESVNNLTMVVFLFNVNYNCKAYIFVCNQCSLTTNYVQSPFFKLIDSTLLFISC